MKNVKEIIRILKKEYPDAKIALRFKDTWQLLVATILSAQCTDERVNKVTPLLFKKYKGISDYANAKLEEFENDMRSTGFYKNKAKNIIAAAKKVLSEFNGNVPNTMEGLTGLPGIGRKTANVILSSGFGIVEGIVVDTHVIRLSNRMGLTKSSNPDKIEQDLMKIIPKNDWAVFSHLLILHGRKICKARRPLCGECKINKLCPSAFVGNGFKPFPTR
ncbi:MAG: endonuclease III [Candidatus Omnitrophica bacterium CG12_big_fil_rev_8_21_14_0_65_42_8]|nr:MAG: endonuclease III [Candidatus Omnitrophica bacterium CG12_big_fil_rev_8_21_14_0_65_42_8]